MTLLVVIVDFARAAPSADNALCSAAEAVEAVLGSVHHAEPGPVVTTGEIADRLWRDRESVRKLAAV